MWHPYFEFGWRLEEAPQTSGANWKVDANEESSDSAFDLGSVSGTRPLKAEGSIWGKEDRPQEAGSRLR